MTPFSTGLQANTASLLGAVAAGPDGNVWFTDYGCNSANPNPGGMCGIGRITANGTITEDTAGFSASSEPYQIAVGPDGNLWFTVAQPGGGAVGKITPQGQVTDYTAGLNAGSRPRELFPGPDGNIWFTDGGTTHAIGRITTSGTITEFTTGLQASNGSDLNDIVQGPDGNMWFTDDGDVPAVGKITPSGAITEYKSGFIAGPNHPYTIAPGPDGNLWFTDNSTGGSFGDQIGKITTSGAITEYYAGLQASSAPHGIVAGADGAMWFLDTGPSLDIGRITTSGVIHEYPTGLTHENGSTAQDIATGADGNLWFTDEGCGYGIPPCAIARFGTAQAAALKTAPTVSGAGQAGSTETCQPASFSTWAGVTPTATVFGFDGHQWLRDGAPIAGQTGSTYVPISADAGHQLACVETATYPLPFLVSAPAASAAITVSASGSPPPKKTPDITMLRALPHTFFLAGRRVGGRCVKATHHNRKHKSCRHPLALGISFELNTPATITVTASQLLAGRSVGGKCVKPTRKNRKHHHCTYWHALAGSVSHPGLTGANAFTFSRLPGHPAFGPGAYMLKLTPTAGSLAGPPQTVRFSIAS